MVSKLNKKNGVIVLGGHVQALGIIRILGRQGVPAVIIDKTTKNIARHSKYCIGSYCVKDDDIIAFLTENGKRGQYRGWQVYPTNDFHVKLLSQNRELLSKFYKVSTGQWDKIEIFYNKVNTYQMARSLSIPIAETFFPQGERDLTSISPVYPCIIKPAVMHDFYSQVKKKVFVCKNPEELLDNYKRACKLIPKNEIIVQNIIPGPSRNQYSACFLFLEGKAYVSLTACRMRQHPLDFGNATTYAEAMDIPVIREYAERILSHAKYEGICEVEFKRDETDGQFKFLEVNTRTWKWHAIAEKTNSPFLLTLYKWLNGECVSPVYGQSTASFRHSLTDLPIQLKLFFKGYNYACRIQRPVVNAVWAFDDMLPYFYEKLYLFHLIKNR